MTPADIWTRFAAAALARYDPLPWDPKTRGINKMLRLEQVAAAAEDADMLLAEYNKRFTNRD